MRDERATGDMMHGIVRVVVPTLIAGAVGAGVGYQMAQSRDDDAADKLTDHEKSWAATMAFAGGALGGTAGLAMLGDRMYPARASTAVAATTAGIALLGGAFLAAGLAD